jgi:endonuclease/exonuclease/phosphatase (EEP) superfamily protein YafD
VTVTENNRDPDDDETSPWPTLVGTGLALSVLAVLLGYLGWLHPIGDSIAVLRSLAVTAVLLFAVAASLLGLRIAAFWSILFAMVTGAPLFLATNWQGPPGSFGLYQKNLRFDNAELQALEADIRAVAPLALTLQEVSGSTRSLLTSLADLYPHQHLCPFAALGSTAVLTNLPPVPDATVCAPGLAAMQVTYTETQRQFPIWIVSIHLHWPWPYGQGDQAAELVEVLADLEGAVLMAGDFNMVRWGYSVRSLARASRTIPAGPSPATYQGLGPLLRLPIDHAFAPRGGRIRLRETLGSDHMGLVAQLEPY